MKLDEFQQELVQSLQRFHQWWVSRAERDPENFPLEMDVGDWEEQFQLWQGDEEFGRILEGAQTLRGTSEEESPLVEAPYLYTPNPATVTRAYNPRYGDDRDCVCGHPYYRHFDTGENMEACGCKYCDCWTFEGQP